MNEITVTNKKDMSGVLLEVGTEECIFIPYSDLEKTIKALFGVYAWLDPAGAGLMLKKTAVATRQGHDD